MLKKIISGGQTGADRAALDASIKYSFPHGGWIPKGRKTEDGRLPDNYKLKEMLSSSYPARTEKNIVDSDGTVIISHGKLTGGSKLTLKFANKHKKPCLHIDLDKIPTFIAASKIISWTIEHNIEVLNIAGSRTSKDPTIYQKTKYIIEGVILLNWANCKTGSVTIDYTEKLPIPPKTVDEAVDLLISDLDLYSQAKIANMDFDDLVNTQSNLFIYFKNAFGVWHSNKELIESCRSISQYLVNNEDDATIVILGVLWKKLYESHKIKIVK